MARKKIDYEALDDAELVRICKERLNKKSRPIPARIVNGEIVFDFGDEEKP